MKIVIDTNVLLVSIGRKSKYHWIFELILNEKVDLLISNGILNEYHEKIGEKIDWTVAENIVKMMEVAPNVEKVEVYYNWNLIQTDADDNKFVDCAIAGNSEYLVTEGHDFDILKRIVFPIVKVINIEEFKQIIDSQLGNKNITKNPIE